MRSPARLAARRHPLAVALAAVGLVGALATGCGSSGRELRAPAPGATAPPRATSTTAEPALPAPGLGLSIASPAWPPGEEVPTAFTCDGAGLSPSLVLGADPSAVELVVVATDPAEGDRVHWLVGGFSPEGASFGQGSLPTGTVSGLNSSGAPGWEPLCPPPGATRTYDFTVYALAAPSGITADTPPTDVGAITAGAIGRAVMTGSYTRG